MHLEELFRRHELALRAADGSPEDGADRQVYLAIARLYAGRIEGQRRRYGLPAHSRPLEREPFSSDVAAFPAKEGT